MVWVPITVVPNSPGVPAFFQSAAKLYMIRGSLSSTTSTASGELDDSIVFASELILDFRSEEEEAENYGPVYSSDQPFCTLL